MLDSLPTKSWTRTRETLDLPSQAGCHLLTYFPYPRKRLEHFKCNGRINGKRAFSNDQMPFQSALSTGLYYTYCRTR